MSQANKAKFLESSPFSAELKQAVDRYLSELRGPRRDHPRMYLKTAVILAWLAGSYAWLMLFASGPLGLVLGSLSLGLAMAGVGFSIMHDGNHGAYSERKGVNRLMGGTLDLVGGSSYVWSWKHNIFHHSHPNIVGLDTDLELGAFGRLAPSQRHRWPYRFQHVYLWFLYGFLAVKWWFVDDFVDMARGKVGAQKVPRPRGAQLAWFLGGKALFFTWILVVPLLVHPVGVVLACFGLVSFVLGVTLSTTFQLAHAVDAAEFPAQRGEKLTTDWAQHQVETTVDFAPGNKLVSWYVGGLNFQVEHHLFPKVSHLHYPAISRIVAEVCREHGVKYRSHATVSAAVASHVRWLRAMGRQGAGAVA